MTDGREQTVEQLIHTYQPSWYDRLSNWIDRRKIPGWMIYLFIPAIWIVVMALVQWIEGAGTILDWDPISFVAILQIGYMLFICQLLDKLALRALNEVKPALNIEEGMYPSLQRMISTLPARRTWLFTGLFGAIGILLILASLSDVNLDSSVTLDQGLFGLGTAITMLFLWTVNGLFVYHTFHQLSVVNLIFTKFTIVHPFHQRELFAFSGFSAQTGLAVILITPLWIVFDPGLVSLVLAVVFALFGLAAFLSPLLGVHRILAREKDRLVDENARQVEKTIESLMSELKGEEVEGLERIDKSLSTLKKAKDQIETISTWPWKTETLRRFIAAVFLPLFIWLLQYLLAQALSS